MNECSNCFFGRIVDLSPHVRPRLTCRAVFPSAREEYVWPVVPDEGWCVNYKRSYPTTASTEGFNTVNVCIDPATEYAKPTVIMTDPETGEITEVEPEPPLSDMRVEFAPDYLTNWANFIIDTLGAFRDAPSLKALWGEDEIKARFVALKASDGTLAKRLHAAVNGRIKALAQ